MMGMNHSGNTMAAPSADHDLLAEELERLRIQVDELTRQVERDQREDTVNLVCFSGEWDRLFAAFVVANGALAMGQEVHMFFTFWASAALRDVRAVGTGRNKGLMERLIGRMLPSGPDAARLSRMHWGGLGKLFMARRMKQCGVEPLSEMMAQAQELGAHLHLCEMSSEILGIDCEDLIGDDEIDACGVATFLSTALKGRVVLFI
jgi:peroxiredoxin family protein